MEDMISTKGTITSEKVINESFKICDYFNKQKDDIKSLNESFTLLMNQKSDIMLESMSLNNSKDREKRLTREHINEFIENYQRSFMECFLYTLVNNATPLDEDIKLLNRKQITNDINKYTDEIMDLVNNRKFGIFTIEENNKLIPVCETINKFINMNVQYFNENGFFSETINNAAKEDIKSMANDLAPYIFDNVINVVKEEKKYVELKEEFSSLEKDLDGLSLFRAIQTKSLKEALINNESSEITDEINDGVFAETVYLYTIIESMNYLGILKIDPIRFEKNIKKLI